MAEPPRKTSWQQREGVTVVKAWIVRFWAFALVHVMLLLNLAVDGLLLGLLVNKTADQRDEFNNTLGVADALGLSQMLRGQVKDSAEFNTITIVLVAIDIATIPIALISKWRRWRRVDMLFIVWRLVLLCLTLTSDFLVDRVGSVQPVYPDVAPELLALEYLFRVSLLFLLVFHFFRPQNPRSSRVDSRRLTIGDSQVLPRFKAPPPSATISRQRQAWPTAPEDLPSVLSPPPSASLPRSLTVPRTPLTPLPPPPPMTAVTLSRLPAIPRSPTAASSMSRTSETSSSSGRSGRSGRSRVMMLHPPPRPLRPFT